VVTEVRIHLPIERATQEQIEDKISVADHLWDICAEEEKTPVESEQLLLAGVRNFLHKDFDVGA
jgi:hypothetical protein